MDAEYLNQISKLLDSIVELVYAQTGYKPFIEMRFYGKTDDRVWKDTEGFGKLTYSIDDDPTSHCWRSNHNITIHK